MKKIICILLTLLLIGNCKSDGKKTLLGLLALLPLGGSSPSQTNQTPAPVNPSNPADTSYANGNSNTNSTDYDFITYGTSNLNPPVVIPPPIVPLPNDAYDTFTLTPFIPGVVSARLLKTAIGVDRFQDLVVEFSEPMDISTVCLEGELINSISSRVRIEKAGTGGEIPAYCRWKGTTSQLFLDIQIPLDPFNDYRVTVNDDSVSILLAAKTLSNLPFKVFTVPSSPVNSTVFKTEPTFNMTINVQIGANTFTMGNQNGTNFNEPNPSSPATVNLISSMPDISRATNVYLYNLRDPSVRYTVCAGSCSSIPNLDLTTISPLALRLNANNVGLQQYYFQIEYQITTTPIQFKRYYRPFSFNWGTLSPNPNTSQARTGRVVLEKGRGGREGTLDVLARFLNDYADKRFSITTPTRGEEFLYDIMRRNMGNLKGADNLGIGCQSWATKNVVWLTQSLIGYNFPVAPFSNFDAFPYYTNVGPFCGFQEVDKELDICIDTLVGTLCTGTAGLVAKADYIADIYLEQATVGFNPDVQVFDDWKDKPDFLLNNVRQIDRTLDGTNYQAGAVRVRLDLIPSQYAAPLIPSDYNLKVTMDVQKMRANLKAMLFISSLRIAFKLNLIFSQIEVVVFNTSWLGISSLTLAAHLDANLDMGTDYTLTNMHAKATVDSGNRLNLSMYSYVDGQISQSDAANKFYAPTWVTEMKILNPSPALGLSLFSSYTPAPDSCQSLTWDAGQSRYEISNGDAPSSQPPRNAASDLTVSYPSYRNWTTFSIQTGTGPGPSFTPIMSTFYQPTQYCITQGGSFLPDMAGFAAWIMSPLKNIINNVVNQIVPSIKPKLITRMLRNFVEEVAEAIFNAVLEPVGKGVKLSLPPTLPLPIGSSTNTVQSNQGMDLRLGLKLTESNVNIAKQDPNGAKGLEDSTDLMLLLNNKSLSGGTNSSGASRSCSAADVTNGLCPATPNGTQSFVLSKSPNIELPYILDLELNKPGINLGLHSDILGQFFYSFWKEGGLNMNINQSFINRLLTYRPKTRPIELLEILLKAQALINVLSPGDSILNVTDSGNNQRTINGTDDIEIRLRPLQTPFVFMNGPTNSYPAFGQTGMYIPKLGISLSDVELEIMGKPLVGPLYRIAVVRLNLKTNARLWTAPYSNPADPIYGNRLSVRLDICNDFNDGALDGTIGEKDCDYDMPGNIFQYGDHLIRPESKDLTFSVVVFDDSIRNPFSLSSNNIQQLISPVVGSVLIPVFNFVLGEIPLPELKHCGINIDNQIKIVGIPTTFLPTDPNKQPMFLLNGLNSVTLSPFTPVGGTCNLTNPIGPW